MKTVSAALQAHFGQSTTTLAVLWRVTRVDGTVLGFTTLDQDLSYKASDDASAVTYKALSGILPTANSSGSDLSVDNLEVSGFLDSAQITEPDIRNGVYDYAVVEQRVVNWQDLTMGDLLLRKGIIGNIKMVNGEFTAEVRGLTQYLSTMVGALYGPMCRAELFSTLTNDVDPGTHYPCWVKEADYTQNGSVGSAIGARYLMPVAGLKMVGSATPTSPAPAGWFADGEITFTSGLNNGFSFEISTWDGTTLFLFTPMPYPPSPGDTFTIEPGCDKTPTATGCLKFQGYSTDGNQMIVAPTNILNFKAEPFIPGMDAILYYPNATT